MHLAIQSNIFWTPDGSACHLSYLFCASPGRGRYRCVSDYFQSLSPEIKRAHHCPAALATRKRRWCSTSTLHTYRWGRYWVMYLQLHGGMLQTLHHACLRESWFCKLLLQYNYSVKDSCQACILIFGITNSGCTFPDWVSFAAWYMYSLGHSLFEVLFYIANQTGIDAQYYDGDRIKSVAR